MSWGLVAVGGASLVGSWISSNASSNAADAQIDATEQGIAAQQEMYDQSLALQQPYIDAGTEALAGMEALTDTTQRAEILNSYYDSDEYSALESQQTEQSLRNAAATGGVRGGNTQAALANISTDLGSSYLTNQYNNLSGIASLGTSATSQAASSANSLGTAQNTAYQTAGTATAEDYLTQGSVSSTLASDLGGLAYNYF